MLTRSYVKAPKINCNAAKLTAVLNHFHSSRVAHSIKDLEKALPSVASINGMQVKDYLQSLQDENKINVEKIGSGNWYWAFPGEEQRVKKEAIVKATEERDKLKTQLMHVREQLEAAQNARTQDDDGERQEALGKETELKQVVSNLKSELADYADSDPAMAEERRDKVESFKALAEKHTDEILEMEQYFKEELCLNREHLTLLKLELYGDEYDIDDEGLSDMSEPK